MAAAHGRTSERRDRRARSTRLPMSSMVPRCSWEPSNGFETVRRGARSQLARNVLVSAVSGAADIGAEAVTATFAGTRGVVAAASGSSGDIADHGAEHAAGNRVERQAVARGSSSGGSAARRRSALKMAIPPGRACVGGDSLLERAAHASQGDAAAGSPTDRAPPSPPRSAGALHAYSDFGCTRSGSGPEGAAAIQRARVM